jgi:hypothetical protein
MSWSDLRAFEANGHPNFSSWKLVFFGSSENIFKGEGCHVALKQKVRPTIPQINSAIP